MERDDDKVEVEVGVFGRVCLFMVLLMRRNFTNFIDENFTNFIVGSKTLKKKFILIALMNERSFKIMKKKKKKRRRDRERCHKHKEVLPNWNTFYTLFRVRSNAMNIGIEVMRWIFKVIVSVNVNVKLKSFKVHYQLYHS